MSEIGTSPSIQEVPRLIDEAATQIIQAYQGYELGSRSTPSAALIREIADAIIELGHEEPEQESADFFGFQAGQILQTVKAEIPRLTSGALLERLIAGYEEVVGEQSPDWRMWAVFKAIPEEPDLSLTMARVRTGYDPSRKKDIIVGTHAVTSRVGQQAIQNT